MSWRDVKLNQKEMDRKVDELREWIKTQPQLPQNIGKESKFSTLDTFGKFFFFLQTKCCCNTASDCEQSI